MKSYPKKWGKLFERYLDEYLPERKDEICARADREYRKLLTQMPDVGGKENMMASNMETWFSIVAFYEASDHVIDGKAFETIYEWHIDPLRFLGKIIDANRSKWVYKLFGIIYDRYEKQLREHQAKGEWKDSWGIAVNPENHKEGYSFHLIGCPIAKHAKENGYEELLPHLCRTDHVLAEVLGYPNWWASIPMPIASFLEEYDFTGKTVIPFCSHGGGKIGQSLTAIAKLAPDAVMGEGLSVHYSGGLSLSDDVAAWLETNGIRKD